jgi:18S rRNA (guanine1575-N7)-methyltransferase
VKVNKEKEGRKEFFGRSKKKIVKRKEFVIKKKERLRRRGHATKPDTKYTGRKRKPKF